MEKRDERPVVGRQWSGISLGRPLGRCCFGESRWLFVGLARCFWVTGGSFDFGRRLKIGSLVEGSLAVLLSWFVVSAEIVNHEGHEGTRRKGGLEFCNSRPCQRYFRRNPLRRPVSKRKLRSRIVTSNRRRLQLTQSNTLYHAPASGRNHGFPLYKPNGASGNGIPTKGLSGLSPAIISAIFCPW